MAAKFDFRLTWTTERSDDTVQFVGSIRHMVTPDHPGDSGLRNFYGTGEGLADLAVTGYYTEGSGWYGMRVAYRSPFQVDLELAEMMVKRLRQINRKLGTLNEQLGWPSDMAQFAARVMVALGAKSSEPYGQYCSEVTANGTHYRWADAVSFGFALGRVTAPAS